MDELLSRATSYAVTLAMRSSMNLAGAYAIKTVTKFLDKIPEGDESRISLETTKARLQRKILIITPAIDLLELVSARGNTSLSSTLELTKDLKRDIDKFEREVDEIYNNIFQSDRGSSWKSTEQQRRSRAVKQIEVFIKDLLARIEEAIPLISLALTTSGANLSSTLPKSVSPGRFLQAANYLTHADQLYTDGGNKNPRGVKVGPVFTMVLYDLFAGSARNPHITSLGDITWKEEYAKCKIQIWRKSLSSSISPHAYKYELEIAEDLSDGRYHDPEELVTGGRTRSIDVTSVTRIFFSASGKLLEIEESTTPVLVLKLNSLFRRHSSPDELSTSVEWVAFEQYHEGYEELDADSDSDSTDSGEDTSQEREEGDVVNQMAALSIKPQQSAEPSISLLEYILRLTALQANDQASMYTIQDERLALYLRDEPSSNATGSTDTQVRTAETAAEPFSPGRGSARRDTRRRESGRHVLPIPMGSSPYTPSASKADESASSGATSAARLTKSSTASSSHSASVNPTPPRSSSSTSIDSSRLKNANKDTTTDGGGGMTPWEHDRLVRNPMLRSAVLEEYSESPLKKKSASSATTTSTGMAKAKAKR